MRLVTWNCCRGAYEAKAPLISHLQADIAVLQEIAKPVTDDSTVLWFGENPKIGMAVQARAPYQVKPMVRMSNVPNYVIPIAVTGPVNFLLFAVWTTNDKTLPYVRTLSRAIDMYSPVLDSAQSIVFMGDFNSNAVWDALHPADLNHTSMVKRLTGRSLVSAYHHMRQVEHGSEVEKTFYLHRNKDKSHHIDYCFVPKSWAEKIAEVRIGTYEELSAASDHRPLLVDLSLPESSL